MPNAEFLRGYRVLDLSQYIPGPFAARSLADLGAEVVKIEPPGGDPMRQLDFTEGGEALSPLYRHLNRGKTIACLNLKTERHRETLRKLLTTADVLVESYRPGVLARLGFGREYLATINPSLIHCALSGFGQTGPYQQRAGHDLTYCAVSGALSASGTRRRPVMTFPPIADHAGALQAVNGILAALLSRSRNGKGYFLDIALSESLLAWQYPALFESRSGNNPDRETLLLNGGAAFYNIYATADHRFVALAALEEKFWRRFCQAVGHSEWIDRQREPLPQKPLIGEVEALFAKRPLKEWVTVLADVDCCFEPVPLLTEVSSHPQIQSRELLSGFEPRYPAWIDDQPLPATKELHVLAENESPSWR